MSRAGLTYDGGGAVTGFTFCSQDDDLALQEAPLVLEVNADHDAVTNPTVWEVLVVDGILRVQAR